MNLQDYLNQQEPKRMPAGSVYVPNEYITNTFNRYDPTQPNKTLKMSIYLIPMFGTEFTYIKEGDNSTLWTSDGDGNSLAPSVFCAMPEPPTEDNNTY